METEIIAILENLPSKSKPVELKQTTLEKYIKDLLIYQDAKLKHELWRTNCEWDKKDYPNLTKGLWCVGGAPIPDCGKKPSLPTLPVLPKLIREKK